MTDKAIIQGTFSDFRLVKGRKVAQIIIEVPIEAADNALSVLGGIPRFDRECWVAVARLNLKPVTPKDHTLSQQAALCCRDPKFWGFLDAMVPDSLIMANRESERAQSAAHWLRKALGVQSRSELDESETAAQKWRELFAEFQEWKAAA